ncbi:hypothetical protein SO802_029582 [Lithocarpus litseifolius]|uniref:Glycine cleavage system H protein n=1 Tax=Lithocarpus litseifolius TaxID=425828 RepID=A0AAW2BVJ6_9ROSI
MEVAYSKRLTQQLDQDPTITQSSLYVLSEELGLPVPVDRSTFVFSVYIFRTVDVHGDGPHWKIISNTTVTSFFCNESDLRTVGSDPGGVEAATGLFAEESAMGVGVIMCLECSGKHRGLGVHISFVRSVTVDSWSEIQIKKMESGGNEQLNSFFAQYGIRPLPMVAAWVWVGGFGVVCDVVKDLKYLESHEWVKVVGNFATVGIIDHAQDHLGDVVYVELPAVGAPISQASSFIAVESVKSTSDINSPISGKVVEVNEELNDSPVLINSSPYDKGWIIKVELSNSVELNNLMDADKYTKFCEEEDASH